jgi:hypothetical protein
MQDSHDQGMYPYAAGAQFDHAYYRDKYMPV